MSWLRASTQLEISADPRSKTDNQEPRAFEPRPLIHERRRSPVSKRSNECFRDSLALERRRLENRSREKEPGNARDGTACEAETSLIDPAREVQRSQAVL